MPRNQLLYDSYPRTRPILSAVNQEHYSAEYEKNRTGSGPLFAITSRVEGWMHRAIARTVQDDGGLSELPVLELGAGGLNHVGFEGDGFPYDALEPLDQLCRESDHFSRIRTLYGSFGSLRKIENETEYGRIFSTAVLEHLVDLPWVVAQSARLLSRDGSIFQAGIPSEGGLGWGLSWRATTGLRYRLKTGGSYSNLMRHEHVNNAREIESVISHFFDVVHVKRFPFPLLHGSIYTYIEATNPIKSNVEEFLAEISEIRAE
jgi:hypothetical protein